jgi:hypothetical protein
MRIEISTKKFFVVIVILILSLFLIDLLAYINGLYKIRNLYLFKKYLNPATERNIPTLLSVFLFFMIGIASTKIYEIEKNKIWQVFKFFFFYLALDDLFMIHEQIGSLLGEALLKGHWKGYYWHGIYDPIFAIFFVLFYLLLTVRFIKKRLWLAFSLLTIGYLLYGVSQFMDYYEGLKHSFFGIREFAGFSRNQIIHIMRTSEETIEMIASLFVLSALLIFLKIKRIIIATSVKFER